MGEQKEPVRLSNAELFRRYRLWLSAIKENCPELIKEIKKYL